MPSISALRVLPAARATALVRTFHRWVQVAVLFRRWARVAAISMILVSLGYLTAGTALTPWLWLDPLGPFVKVIPGAMLAMLLIPLLENR